MSLRISKWSDFALAVAESTARQDSGLPQPKVEVPLSARENSGGHVLRPSTTTHARQNACAWMRSLTRG
jgi:hypothetical protein